MKNKAFTLIELLVAILIIGILAAIAFAQYNKVVEKSNATQALTLLQAVYQSATRYELSTGNWPSSLEVLDIDIPPDFKGDGEWEVVLESSVAADISSAGVLRKKGKYTGTGFTKSRKHQYSMIPKETNLCFENQVNKPIFNGAKGSYCNKIFDGKPKYVGEKNWVNIWALP